MLVDPNRFFAEVARSAVIALDLPNPVFLVTINLSNRRDDLDRFVFAEGAYDSLPAALAAGDVLAATHPRVTVIGRPLIRTEAQ